MPPFLHRALIAAVGLAALAAVCAPSSASADQCGYQDVPDTSEFSAYVCDLRYGSVMSGTAPGFFDTRREMTRGEVAASVMAARRMAPDTAGGPRYADVPPGSPFYEAVETLTNAGIVSGSGGRFRPDEGVTRGEFSTVMVRSWAMPVDLTGAPHFDDLNEASPSYQYVETLHNNDRIISGFPDGVFRQDDKILRQEAAKMLARTRTRGIVQPGFNAGSGARLSVNASPSSLLADCATETQVNATVFDRFGNVVEGFTGEVRVTTTLGTFRGASARATEGIATFALRSCEAGTATVTAVSPGYTDSTVRVRFEQASVPAAPAPSPASAPAPVRAAPLPVVEPGPVHGTLVGMVTYLGRACRTGEAAPQCTGPYAGYPLTVHRLDGTTVAGRTTTGADGQYSIPLPEGIYTVRLPDGPGQTRSTAINVIAGKVTRQALTIDEGVR